MQSLNGGGGAGKSYIIQFNKWLKAQRAPLSYGARGRLLSTREG